MVPNLTSTITKCSLAQKSSKAGRHYANCVKPSVSSVNC